MKFLKGCRRKQIQRAGISLATTIGFILFAGLALRAQSSAPKSQPKQAGAQPSGKQPSPAKKAVQKLEQLQLETPQLETPKPAKPSAKPKTPAKKQKELIEAIIFRGNRRVPSSVLRARIFSRPGDVYSVNALERDFMALWHTGYFDDIRLEVQNGKKGEIVIFYVREKKLVRAITYKGLHSVQQSDVLEAFQKQKVGLTIDSQFDPVVVKRAEVVLRQMLGAHGRQFATVRARTRNIPPNSVALTFIVTEGPKVKVGKITFQGNTVFPNRELVQQMKLSRPTGLPPWFYWFHKTYDHDKVLFDLEKVRELYQDHGYFFAIPEEPKVKMRNTAHHWPLFFWSWGHGKAVDITIPVEQGHQYKLGKFTIHGAKLFKAQKLKPLLGMKQGEVFDLSKVRKTIKNLTELYGDFGYINFVATPDPEPDRKKRIVNLSLDFDEGKQFFIHRINFSGNTKTRDKVIRRELMLNEGQVFNSRLWKLSILKVNQLGFFNPIKKEDYDIKQNAKNDTVDINLKVKEKGRNSIGFSGGTSGYSGNFIGFNYSTSNFLGLGETLSFSAQTGQYQKLYQFGFTEPYVLDRPITTGFTVYKSDVNFNQLEQTSAYQGISQTYLASAFGASSFQNFAQNSTGFTAFASYPLKRHFARLGLTYSFSNSSLQTFSLASQAYFEALNFQNIVSGPNSLTGIRQSSIMPTFNYSTIDNYRDPHTGKSLFATFQFAGSALGGNVNTIEPTVEAKYYHPINHDRNTLAFHLLFSTISGYGGKVPPPYSRFYMGGETTIRGFDIYSVSPIAFFPTTAQVCNRDSEGNIITALNSNGASSGSCGSYTKFPVNTVTFPGGDTELLTNFEYRIPIVGPVSVAPFIDAGMDFVWHTSQLNLRPTALLPITQNFSYFKVPTKLQIVPGTNYKPRSSLGISLQVIVPHFNIPFHLYYGYNWLRLNRVITPPTDGTLPPQSLFPNMATYDQIMTYFQPFHYAERRSMVGFTVAQTF